MRDTEFLKETILEAVVNGPFDADKTLDGQVDMKTLDAVLTMFYDSCSQEHVVESLFDMNADGQVSDTFSKFSLYIACIEGWNDIVKLLLDNGANIESKDLHGWTPLMHTAVAGRTRALRLLLDRGANIKSWTNQGDQHFSELQSAVVRMSSNSFKNEAQALNKRVLWDDQGFTFAQSPVW